MLGAVCRKVWMNVSPSFSHTLSWWYVHTCSTLTHADAIKAQTDWIGKCTNTVTFFWAITLTPDLMLLAFNFPMLYLSTGGGVVQGTSTMSIFLCVSKIKPAGNLWWDYTKETARNDTITMHFTFPDMDGTQWTCVHTVPALKWPCCKIGPR